MEMLKFGSVSVWLGEKSGKYPDGNQVIVQGSSERVAFDTPQVALHIGAPLLEVDRVILGHVHEDHMVALHALPHAQVQVHEADLAAAQSWEGLARHYGYPPDVLESVRQMIVRDFAYHPRPDATAYRDGDTWDLGGGVTIRAHHLPGHTSGHSALVVESEGVAFIGDIDLTGFGPYYGDASSSLSGFRSSLKRLPDIPAKVWVTAHHRGVYTDREQLLRDLAAYEAKLDEREQRILALLQESPRTLAQLAEQRVLYPQNYQSPSVADIESRTISQHLAELMSDGRVDVDEQGVYRRT